MTDYYDGDDECDLGESLGESDEDLEWGCQFPDTCVMPGEHMLSECHTAEMIMIQEEAMGNRLEEIKRQHSPLDNTNHVDAGLGYCAKCWLIAEVERLNREMAEGYGCKLCHCCGEKSHGELEQLRQAMLKQARQQEQEIEELEAECERLRQAGMDEVSRGLELEAANCAMREALREVAEDDDPRDGCAHADRAKQALASTPVCPHKEEAERLREEMVTGEAGGRLLQAIQEKTQADAERLMKDKAELEAQVCGLEETEDLLEARLVALQAALDETNGLVMEWEHRAIGFHCGPCEKCNRSREDWTKAARERREVR